MTSLAHHLSSIVGDIFAAQNLPAELGTVRISDRPDLAQFQCNGAMAAAKIVGKPPREIAEHITAALLDNPHIAAASIAGPGFININLTDAVIQDHLTLQTQNANFGVPKAAKQDTIVLDYGGPNVAKAMHVGHLRSSIIGESLRRFYLFAGYKTLGDVHLGDWGLPMGQLISALEIQHPDWPYFKEQDSYPSESPVTIDDLAALYPLASAACKEDETRLAAAREATAKLQDGHKGYRALWRHFVNVSIADIKENFENLDVHFDLWLGESDAHDTIAPMVKDLQDRNIGIESEGAIVIPVAKNSDNKEMPPLILLKSDGAVMYGTTDLATIKDRMDDYNPAKIIYVVDQRQALHFEQVFRAARKGEITPESTDLIHAGFGTMNGTDGKPFKTRAGGIMKLEDLIAMGVEKATTRLNEASLAQDMSETERADIANKVAIAAIKFADLQNNRISDYIFDLDRMTAFEGKTGPYLLYQVVRIKSLLAKATDKGLHAGKLELTDIDRPLALLIGEFPDHFATALHNHTPHVLCDYAYKLAQTFSSFYGNCHILTEENEALRASRLQLCTLTADLLQVILDLLGIAIPERM
jgi:arginyl-tRNA synthetase